MRPGTTCFELLVQAHALMPAAGVNGVHWHEFDALSIGLSPLKFRRGEDGKQLAQCTFDAMMYTCLYYLQALCVCAVWYELAGPIVHNNVIPRI